MIDTLLLTAAKIFTFDGDNPLTNASGFFFARGGRLYLVTSRHVMFDEPSEHYPDRIQVELHVDPDDIARSTGFGIPLYRDRKSLWVQARDAAGDIDVALIELDRSAMPKSTVYRAFTPEHLYRPGSLIEIGSPLLVLGFPLGFHDTLHHLPVARQAGLASSFGMRFQGEGYFLTDARTHRGGSGAPVVMRIADPETVHGDLPWRLLGIHSARLDMLTRDSSIDEALGLNCAWYADVLMTLTPPSARLASTESRSR
ncbi:MAG TPA: serine protease [Burkholderiaceae bacterium]|jgi:S1-C subfamily serine protease|nr:serine protease [Burkholderiaceae bacterium]